MNNVNTNTAAYVGQRVAANLNLTDVTPQSKLTLLVQGLLNEGSIFDVYNKDTLKNMYIQTASEEYLEMIAASSGLSRVLEPLIRLTKDDRAFAIEPIEATTHNLTLERGAVLDIVEGSYWFRLNEELDLSTLTAKKYLNGDLITTTSKESVALNEGSSFRIMIEEKPYRVLIERNLFIPTVKEDLETFRKRILYSRQTTRTGTESAIALAISSLPLVTEFTTNFNKNPFELTLFNRLLLEEDGPIDNMNRFIVPLLESKLSFVASEGSSFTINLPKKVNFSLLFRKNKPQAVGINPIVYSLIEQIKRAYQLGEVFRVDIKMVEDYLDFLEEDKSFLKDYDLIIMKNFLGRSYESSSSFIEVKEDEYPFLYEVLVE